MVTLVSAPGLAVFLVARSSFFTWAMASIKPHSKNAPYCLTLLFLVDKRRPADFVGLKGDRHLDAVADLDERDTFVHPVVLTVEGHYPFNAALAPVPLPVSLILPTPEGGGF